MPSVQVKKYIFIITRKVYLPIKSKYFLRHTAQNFLSHEMLFTLIDTYTFRVIIYNLLVSPYLRLTFLMCLTVYLAFTGKEPYRLITSTSILYILIKPLREYIFKLVVA